MGLRWALTLLVLGLAACNGGGYNASGTWEGVATNRSYPFPLSRTRLQSSGFSHGIGAPGPKDGGASGGRAVSRVAFGGRRGLW